MPITLSGTRITANKETGKGETWNNAYSIQDIYDASVGVTLDASGTYSFNGLSLYSGTATYVKLKDCVINFVGNVSDGTYIMYAVGTGSSGFIQLGEKSGANISNGVVINTLGLTVNKNLYITNAYDSTIMCRLVGSGSTLGTLLIKDYDGCKIMNGGTATNYNIVLNAKRSIISGCYYGMRSPLSGSVIENLVINGCVIGVWLYQSKGLTLKNVDARGNTVDIRNQTTANISIENTIQGCLYEEYDNRFNTGVTTQDTYCILNIEEFFDLNVLDTAGNPINGANVKLFDKNNNPVFDVNTDVSGAIAQQNVRRIRDEIRRLYPDFISTRTINTYNPFKLLIYSSGKQEYESILTIDKSLEMSISLLDDVSPVFYQQQIDGSISTPALTGSLSYNTLNGSIITPDLSGTIIQNQVQGTINSSHLAGDIY